MRSFTILKTVLSFTINYRAWKLSFHWNYFLILKIQIFIYAKLNKYCFIFKVIKHLKISGRTSILRRIRQKNEEMDFGREIVIWLDFFPSGNIWYYGSELKLLNWGYRNQCLISFFANLQIIKYNLYFWYPIKYQKFNQ